MVGVGLSGPQGNDGVQQGIKSVEGGVGYLEWSFVISGGLYSEDRQRCRRGRDECATRPERLSARRVIGTGDDLSLKLDYATKVAGAYPITGVTYELVCPEVLRLEFAALVKSFFTYTSTDGQQGLAIMGYAAAAAIATKVQASVSEDQLAHRRNG